MAVLEGNPENKKGVRAKPVQGTEFVGTPSSARSPPTLAVTGLG
jgi:hypothetical protein